MHAPSRCLSKKASPSGLGRRQRASPSSLFKRPLRGGGTGRLKKERTGGCRYILIWGRVIRSVGGGQEFGLAHAQGLAGVRSAHDCVGRENSSRVLFRGEVGLCRGQDWSVDASTRARFERAGSVMKGGLLTSRA